MHFIASEDFQRTAIYRLDLLEISPECPGGWRARGLFDHFGGASEQSRCYSEAKRLRCPEINAELIRCRRFDRQVGGFTSLEDPIDVARGPTILADVVGTVRGQTATDNPEASIVDRG